MYSNFIQEFARISRDGTMDDINIIPFIYMERINIYIYIYIKIYDSKRSMR